MNKIIEEFIKIINFAQIHIDMNIQAEKLELMKMILNTENPSLLQKIKKIFTKEEDFWDSLTNVEQDEILQGIAELEKGEAFSYDEVMKKHR